MILHKLLFFRLPYQHAETENSSADGEGEKMERLEREVLNYPGFAIYFILGGGLVLTRSI
jgi:hypothetical protein